MRMLFLISWAWMALLAACGVMLSGCTEPKPAPGPAIVAPTYTTDRPEELPRRLAIPLQEQGDHMLVAAAVNGTDAGLFLLDTGAGIDAIGLGLAGRLGLPVTGKGTAIGIGGRERFRYRPVESLSIASLELPSRQLAGINLNRMTLSIGTTVNGVVGYGSLRRLPFTIDYRYRTLTFYRPSTFAPPGAEEGAVATPFIVRGGVPRIRADFGRGRRVWLILDTGAGSELSLPMSVVERWPDIVGVPVSGQGQSLGVGGAAGQTRTWLKSMAVMGVELHYVPVNFERTPPGAMEVGRIGHRLLRNFELTFDPRRNVVYATFQPER